MVDLKIIEGDEKGYFNPKGEISRGGWCKLTYIAKYGEDDGPIGNPSLKDVKGWYSGYVAAMEAEGVVNGNGDGTFSPENPITVLGAAKTLLAVLGWDCDLQGYANNDNWKNNVKRAATAHGLFRGLIQTDVNKNLTREDAAQMIYNVLSCETVENTVEFNANGKPYIKSQSKSGTTLAEANFDGLKVVSATVKELDIDAKTGAVTAVFVDDSGKVGGYNKADVNAKIAATAADVGKTVTFFVRPGLTKGSCSVVSSRLGEGVMIPLLTYTGVIDWSDGDFFDKDKANNTKYIGVEVNTTADVTVNGGALQAGQTVSGLTDTKLGEVVEFYTTDATSTKANLIRIYQYKTDVVAATGIKETKDDSGKVTDVALNSTVHAAPANISGYEGLEAGDVFLYYTDNTNFIVAKPETVEGKVTGASKDGKLTIGGKQYSRSDVAEDNTTVVDDFAGWQVSDNKDKSFIFYLDKGGNVCYAKSADGTVAGTDYSKVAVIMDLGIATVQGTTDKYGSTGTNTVYKAELLYEDGTHGVVTVASVNDAVPAAKNTPANTTTGAPEEVNWAVNASATAGSTEAKIQPWATAFNYELDEDGNTVLTEIATAGSGDAAPVTNLKMEGKPSIDGATNPEYAGNSKTVYVIEDRTSGKAETYTYSTKTGYANAPKLTVNDDTKAKAVVVHKSNVATLVFLTTNVFADAEAQGMYFLKDNNYEQTVDGVKFNVIDPDGKDTTITVANEVAFSSGSTLKAPFDDTNVRKFFKTTAEKDGVITGVDTTAEAVGTTALTVLSEGIYKLGNDYVTYDSDYTIIVIDMAASSAKVTKVAVVAPADAGSVDITTTSQYVYGVHPANSTTLYVFRIAKP